MREPEDNMTSILDLPAAGVEIPFSILDTDLYKVSAGHSDTWRRRH